MYRRCVYCIAGLGTNETVEAFPVGRRLAFDAGRGRLWVVCRRCERWNLSPLEARWEAVDECERLFSETRTRVSTEEIGLARTREGLDLVRIGRPRRPEFAAWRYGDQFGRRRRHAIAGTAIGVALAGGVAIGVSGLVSISAGVLPLHLWNLARGVRAAARGPLRIAGPDGEALEIRPTQLGAHKLRPEGDRGWHLEVKHREGASILTGPQAVHALGQILPQVNTFGGSRRQVQRAVRELEDVGGPEAYFAAAEYRARRRGRGYMLLAGLPRDIRLALEMASHEEAERVALEGELRLLERAWKEAESIAKIADDLLLSDRVKSVLARLKRRNEHELDAGREQNVH